MEYFGRFSIHNTELYCINKWEFTEMFYTITVTLFFRNTIEGSTFDFSQSSVLHSKFLSFYSQFEFFWSVFSCIWTLSVFGPNMGKHGPEKLRIRTLFMHYLDKWNLHWTYENGFNLRMFQVERPSLTYEKKPFTIFTEKLHSGCSTGF